MFRLLCCSTVLTLLLSFSTVAHAHSDDVELGGDIGQYIVPVAALACSTVKKDQEGVCQFLQTGVVTMSSVFTLKYAINSKRPRGGGYSFPSGHTASAFWGAAYLHRRYGMHYGLPAYIAASFVGFSRVHAKKHHTIDVLAAAGISAAAGYFLASPCGLTPAVSRDGCSLTLQTAF